MDEFKWKVVPLCEAQKLDVDPADIIFNGLYRKCNTYKSGGGYDKFPSLAKNILDIGEANLQFVVQLYGCNLDCPYCYVTKDGIWGSYKLISTKDLVQNFIDSKCNVFHLMGGAPAIVMNHWPELLSCLSLTTDNNYLFHSDFLLTEFNYNPSVLSNLKKYRCLFAVNIKGVDSDTYFNNTRRKLDNDMIWNNIQIIEDSGIPFYFTFTNIKSGEVTLFWQYYIERLGSTKYCYHKRNSFSISLIEYQALKFNEIN